MVTIEAYHGQKEVLVRFMEQLQDYLVSIDPIKRLRRPPEYGEIYTNNLLKKIQEHNGMIYLAFEDTVPIGMIAGNIQPPTEEEKIERIPSQVGTVIDFFVDETQRGKKVGLALMNKMEEYFRSQHCDALWLEVFVPNTRAREFYKTFGFEERLVEMLKRI